MARGRGVAIFAAPPAPARAPVPAGGGSTHSSRRARTTRRRRAPIRARRRPTHAWCALRAPHVGGTHTPRPHRHRPTPRAHVRPDISRATGARHACSSRRRSKGHPRAHPPPRLLAPRDRDAGGADFPIPSSRSGGSLEMRARATAAGSALTPRPSVPCALPARERAPVRARAAALWSPDVARGVRGELGARAASRRRPPPSSLRRQGPRDSKRRLAYLRATARVPYLREVIWSTTLGGDFLAEASR